MFSSFKRCSLANPEKIYDGFHKNIKQHSCFQHWFVKHQIILEYFLMDHVTLKTGEMTAKNSAVIPRKNYIQKYIQMIIIFQFSLFFYCKISVHK